MNELAQSLDSWFNQGLIHRYPKLIFVSLEAACVKKVYMELAAFINTDGQFWTWIKYQNNNFTSIYQQSS